MATVIRSVRPQPASDDRHLTVQVLAVVPSARDTLTISLALPHSRRAPAPYLPGQFITLALPASTGTLFRSYSLAGDGNPARPWQFTIKRQQRGIVSGHLHAHVQPGMALTTSLPQGRFTLPARIQPGSTFVFVAGGSGITPIYGMLRALARLAPAQRPHVQLYYAYRAPEDALYGRELAALDPDHAWLTQHQYVSASGHRLSAANVLSTVGADAASAEWYLCGPAALKQSVQTAALKQGVPEDRIHIETFASPTRRDVSARGGQIAGQVRLADTGDVLAARPHEPLLETLERNGYAPDFECRAGACGTCKLRLVAGQVRNGDGSGLTRAERDAGYILSCSAEPVGNVTLATAGKRNATGHPIAGVPYSENRNKLRLWLTAAAAIVFLTSLGLASNGLGNQSNDSGNNSSTTGGDGSPSSTQYPYGSGSFNNNPGGSGSHSSSGVS